MELWHPRARQSRVNKSTLGWTPGTAWKAVLHTTEGSNPNGGGTNNYHGHQGWPHAEISLARGIEQYFPISGGVFTLKNTSGGPGPNRSHTVQAEIVWFAGRAREMPDDLLRLLADWVGWTAAQTGMPLRFAELWRPGTIATPRSPLRFTQASFDGFSGIVGHSNAPGNDHWDPGNIDVDKLRRFLGSTPGDRPDPLKEDEVFSRSSAPTCHLIATHNGLMVGAAGTEPRQRAVLELYPADGGLDQRFVKVDHQDGTSSFYCRDRASKLFGIDVPNNDGQENVEVILFDYNESPAQRFDVVEVEPNVVEIHHAASGLALDASNRNKLILFGSHHGRNQRFLVAPTI